MEYLKNHQEITNTELKKILDFTITSFKSDYEDGRTALKSIDDTRRRIWDEFIETSFIYKYKDHFEEVYRIYRLSLPNYNKNKVDVVKSVLKNEAHEEFLKRLKIKKVSNYTYDEDFDSINYESFIVHLLKYDVYQNSYNRLGDNIELYKLFYEVNNYEDFTLEKFDGHVVNSTLFKKIFSEYYPSKKIPIAVKRIDDYLNTVYDIIEDSEELNVPVINSETKDKIRKQTFEIDEQLLILNLCLSDKNSIPLTEKIKLIILIGEIKDDSILYESSSNNNVYQKVNKGILRRGSSNTMIDTIDSIKIQIDEFDLVHTKQTLKKHRTTLISEQKETK